MSDPRDDLAALIDRVFDEFEPAAVRDEIADAILARWRLVPVGDICPNPAYLPSHGPGTYPRDCQTCHDRIAAQHRAADELTHHDQTAGHYSD
jgi:hypothetical protein